MRADAPSWGNQAESGRLTQREFIGPTNSTQAYKKSIRAQEKNHPKGLGGTVPVMHTSLGIVPVPKGQTKKTHNLGAMGEVLKILP